ncbi:PAS domain S-box protein [Ferrovibrio terrae]|uniref:histidine kinase n=1 Tax=Ferrovibrio terrae TaxID=2594003 RepID=A0A516H0E1_9PROT|nr:PAS domain-containing sensor histidine kinase [Ferrovibrio terrae]QDO97248.1 PAS domain S-box protein [Ferrovibrio terrae]
MILSTIQISAALAPLLVALACLMAWRYLDGGRHLLFWALGHALLALAFLLLAVTPLGLGSGLTMVATLCTVSSAIVLASGIRVLVGYGDRLIYALLAGVAVTVAVVAAQRLGHYAIYTSAPFVSLLCFFYGGTLLLLKQRSIFYTVTGIILLARGGLSLIYTMRLVDRSTSMDSALALSILLIMLTGLGLMMIEFDNARRSERRARDAEHETAQFLEALLNAMPATMSYKDRDLRYRMMNRRMRELRQANNVEYMGRTWSEIVGPSAAAVIEDIDRRLLETGEPTHMEQAWTGPDGRPIVLFALKVPLRDTEGRVMGIITCGIDISRLKETEAQLIEQREAAEGASRAKSAFLSNMSHELRTPLNAIIGFAQMLSGGYAGPLSERQLGYAANVQESGEHLLRLVNDILDLSRLESGRLDIRIESCSFDQIAQSALAMVQPQARQAEITLSCAPTDLTLHADPRALTQILVNLLGNAVKFSRPQGSVSLEASKDNGIIRIRVRDTGIGMSESESRAMSQPLHLHRIDVYRTRANSGAGLGLSICRSLVELHGGRLEILSQPGKGTTVDVLLPG